jgi:hypothetical protein
MRVREEGQGQRGEELVAWCLRGTTGLGVRMRVGDGVLKKLRRELRSSGIACG